ncbi:MAG: hypothetical protein BM563_01010 [Bacteroidetes bacterium MedPE-SWsnd-G1]|nr:MAG: hypothetical protein BM563_01010 [Bacteroidetes bacterium MedPE-SWsnd-G1]
MLKFQQFIILLFIVFFSCNGSSNSNEFISTKSSGSSIISLELVYKNSIFSTTISGNEIILNRKLPYGVKEYIIGKMSISEKAKSDRKVGDKITLDTTERKIKITSEDGQSIKEYVFKFDQIDYASIVAKHGNLRAIGNKIVDKNDEAVSLAGNSFFWSNDNWGGERFYKSSTLEWLKLDWETTIVRAALGVDETGGYLDNKTSNKNRLKTIVDAAIENDVYVIIDWHSHHAENYQEEAITFFREMATTYGDFDNVIYEIYNEPLNVSWSETIKPYAEAVIKAIREIDPDNMIVVGTPEWSQRVDLAAKDPIIGYENIAYVLHFYTVHHQQWLRDIANEALNSGIPIFITEWGSIGYKENDPETDKWMEWCKTNNISHLNWAVNSKEEEWSIVKPNSNVNGNWSDDDLTAAGKLTRRIIRNWND